MPMLTIYISTSPLKLLLKLYTLVLYQTQKLAHKGCTVSNAISWIPSVIDSKTDKWNLWLSFRSPAYTPIQMDKIHLVSKTIIFHGLKSDWVSSVELPSSHQITSDSREDKDWSTLLIKLMYRHRIKFWLIFHCTFAHIAWLDMNHNSIFPFEIKKKTKKIAWEKWMISQVNYCIWFVMAARI